MQDVILHLCTRIIVRRVVDPSSCIRDAELKDSDEIARLCIELGYPVSPAAMATRISALRESDSHYIAVACGPQSRLLGWVAAEHRLLLESGERVEIVGLVIDRSTRRKGVGKALVSAVECWTAARGFAKIFVRSNIVRSDAHHFYEGIGYQRTKTQHAYTKTVSAA